MKPETTEDVLELLDGYVISAALGAAMELGIFWLLAENPAPAPEVAESLSVPLNRCHGWLQLLCKLGLLENGPRGYAPSRVAREAILDAQSQHFWAFHAREDRRSSGSVRDLALNIGKPMSTWEAPSLTPPDEYQQTLRDPGYAEAFTRMLYEIHMPLTEQLASLIDLRGIKRLMDLGGGSGVVSFALLRKQSDLTSVVIDVDTVCQAGRQIAVENKLADRITYRAADLLKDDLPTGFDMVLLCEVGSFSQALLGRIRGTLKGNGHLVVVDKLAPSETDPPPSRLSAAFLASLEHPAQSTSLTTVDMAQTRLQAAGFRDLSVTPVPHQDNLRWNVDWIMLEAQVRE